MPRRNRIVFEGAWYHVFNRSAGRKTICFSKANFQLFLLLLSEISTKYKVEVHAYCMMKNHYHLLLRTPKANLSDAMWYFGRKFSVQINKEINSDGPLFRNRFKSILVDSDSYLINVCRYIHLNPVEANLCTLPEKYEWSSYCSYTAQSGNPKFLKSETLLSHFLNVDEFKNYHDLGIDTPTRKFYSSKRVHSVLGNQEFLKSCLEKCI